MSYHFIKGLVMFACTAGWAQEPPAPGGSELSFFDFLGSMVEDESEGWIDPLDLHESYEQDVAIIGTETPPTQVGDSHPPEEVGEDE